MTIYALSTAPGHAGIAVIRLSGDKVPEALQSLGCPALPPARRAVTHRFLDIDGSVIDHGLLLYFPAPHSATGEDVAECHIHGGPAIIRKMLERLGKLPGLRMAEPGEFTRIAFRNGKMDLIEAEAISDLIHAETEQQRKQAVQQSEGALSRHYAAWHHKIADMLAHLEAYIDFPEEDIPEHIYQQLTSQAEELASELKQALKDAHRGEIIRSGVQLAIIGPPNAGKSTLLNQLAQRDVAIVSDIAGTTRDVIEVHLDIGGYAVIAADTAGLRETSDSIESEGIRRALARAQAADITLLVLDGNDPALPRQQEKWQAHADLILLNKSDICHGNGTGYNSNKAMTALPCSSATGEGLEQVLEAIGALIEARYHHATPPLITRHRHREQCQTAYESLRRFPEAPALELQCEELRHAAKAIGQITGSISVDDILDRIFGEFCIGK